MKSSGQDILLPEKKRSKEPRSIFFEVNSNDRNRRINKTSSEFRWNFPVPIKEVRQLRIVGGSVPQPFNNIDAPFNAFTLRVGIDHYDIVVPPGQYDAATLCTKISNLINIRTAPTHIFSASVDGASGRFKLERATGFASFTLLFGQGGAYVDLIEAETGGLLETKSLATFLGFHPATNADSDGGLIITSPFTLQLSDRLGRIYLYMNYESSQDLTVISRGLGRHSPSLIIYMDQGTSTVKFLNKETYDIYVLSRPAPLSRISWLDISFRDEYYRPVNFNGREVTLLFEAVVYDR